MCKGVLSMNDNLSVKIRDIAYSKDNVSRKYVQSTNDNHRQMGLI